MINVSSEFRELMKTRTNFSQHAEITTFDNAVWILDESDFKLTGNTITDSASTQALPLGVVVGRTIKLSITNNDGRFNEVSFFKAKIRITLSFQLSASVESIDFGTFTVITPEEFGDSITIYAVDDSYLLDSPYYSNYVFPQTASFVFREICSLCNILYESASFRNNDFIIENRPEDGITFRQMVGYIAMLAGGNARFNRFGRLEILTYEFPEFYYSDRDYDGGNFTDWASGDNLDGGNFTGNAGDDADGGGFNPWDAGSTTTGNVIVGNDTHLLDKWINLKMFSEDIVVTGLKTTKTIIDANENEKEVPVMYGSDGYVVTIDNPLIAGKEEAALILIGDVLIGAKIRNFEGDYIAYPLAEFMDKAVIVDRKGTAAATVLTDINFNFFGITTLKNSAAPPVRQSGQYSNSGAQAIIKVKELIKKEQTQRELSVKVLSEALDNSSGLFSTEETQADGSIVTYLHDKPLLSDSQTVIKRTAEAIGISNDGGVNYEFGLFFSGQAVLDVLDAEGINADWIRSGDILVTDPDGNVTFHTSYATGKTFISGEVNVLSTETGYEFGREGLKINKQTSAMSTFINEDGMDVMRYDENVLSANSNGVNAMNLTARKFLTIGKNSRFEDYKSDRTACYFIGIGDV